MSPCVLSCRNFLHLPHLPVGPDSRDAAATVARQAARWAEKPVVPGASFPMPAAAQAGCGCLGQRRVPLNVLIWRQPHHTCAMARKTDHPRPELSRSIFKLSPCFMGCTRTDAQATRGHLSMF